MGGIASYRRFNVQPWISTTSTGYGVPSGMVLDGSTEKLAIKYLPHTTSAITDIDLRLDITGAPGSFRLGVFANVAASEIPDNAAQLGGWSGTFAAPGADGMTGLQTLGSDTGALTINTPVWIVLEYVSGTIGASDLVQLSRLANGVTSSFMIGRVRHYNGTNWTTTAAVSCSVVFAVKHASGEYGGMPAGADGAGFLRSGANDIYVNGGTVQTQGLRFRTGAKLAVAGVEFVSYKAGVPNDLVIKVYEGDTEKDSVTIDDLLVSSNNVSVAVFDSPVLLAANTDCYVLFTQTGTSNADDYDIFTWGFSSEAYLNVATVNDRLRFVYGNGVVPSALTVSTTDFPWIVLLIADETVDLDETASGTTIAGTPMLRGMV